MITNFTLLEYFVASKTVHVCACASLHPLATQAALSENAVSARDVGVHKGMFGHVHHVQGQTKVSTTRRAPC